MRMACCGGALLLYSRLQGLAKLAELSGGGLGVKLAELSVAQAPSDSHDNSRRARRMTSMMNVPGKAGNTKDERSTQLGGTWAFS
jgi:hypothetical protein